MRDNYILGIIALFLTTSILAQPTLDLSDLTPSIGDQFTHSLTQWVQMDDGGANQTWDYSNLTSDQSRTTEYIDPSTAPNINLFPEATHVSKTLELSQYGYSSYANNRSEIVGLLSQQGGAYQIYPNPRTLLEFPLAYNSAFQDTYALENVLGGEGSIIQYGTVSASCDGYGTLIIPSGIYTDVVRVRYTITSTLEVILNSEVISSVNSTEIAYFFFAAGIPASLLTMVEYESDDGVTSTAANMYSGGVLNIENNEIQSSLNVYPNPATDFAFVEFQLDNSQYVSASLFSLDGRVIEQYSAQNFSSGQNKIQLEIPAISSGVYLLQLKTGHITAHRKIHIE